MKLLVFAGSWVAACCVALAVLYVLRAQGVIA